MNTDAVVDVSVIIPTYAAYSSTTLLPCIDAVLRQDFAGHFEVICVSSADTEGELPLLPSDPRLIHLTRTSRLQAAPARNIGAARARGRMLAFTDGDVIVATDWLTQLVAASDKGKLVVAGSVVNGTPKSAVGTVMYMLEFVDLHPRRRPRNAWHGATCNLLVPKTYWASFGPFPEDMGGGEDTVFTGRARANGVFVFCGEARVTHLNRTGLLEVLTHLTRIGRFNARMARRTWVKYGFLLRHSYLAPLAALGRVISVYSRIFAWARELILVSILFLPLVVAGLGAWAWGLATEGARLEALGVRNRIRSRSDATADRP